MRIDAYLLYYLIAFMSLFLILLIVDKSGFTKDYVNKFHDSAFASKAYVPKKVIKCVDGDDKLSSNVALLFREFKDENERRRLEFESSKEEIKRASSFNMNTNTNRQLYGADDSATTSVPNSSNNGNTGTGDEATLDLYDTDVSTTTSVPNSSNNGGASDASSVFKERPISKMRSAWIGKTYSENIYDQTFNEYLFSGRCYLGCKPFIYPNGFTVNFFRIRLRPGVYEDFILHLFNNHSLLATMLVPKNAVFNRTSRRYVFLIQNAFGFFVSNFMSNIFILLTLPEYLYSTGTSNYLTQTAFDIICTSQLALLIGSAFLFIYRRSRKHKFSRNKPCWVNAFVFLAKLSIVPIVLLFCSLLVLCALLTHNMNPLANIFGYVYQVILVGVISDVIIAMMKFESQYHFAVYVLFDRICVVNIGQLYVERLLRLESKAGVDYYDFSRSIFGGLIRIDRILQKKYAIARKWHAWAIRNNILRGKSLMKLLDDGSFRADFGSSYMLSDANDEEGFGSSRMSHFVQINPLHRLANVERSSTERNMENSHLDRDFDDDDNYMQDAMASDDASSTVLRPSVGFELEQFGRGSDTYAAAKVVRERAAPSSEVNGFFSANLNYVLSQGQKLLKSAGAADVHREPSVKAKSRSIFAGLNPMHAGGKDVADEASFAEEEYTEEVDEDGNIVHMDRLGNKVPIGRVMKLKNMNVRSSFAAKIAFFSAQLSTPVARTNIIARNVGAAKPNPLANKQRVATARPVAGSDIVDNNL